MPHEIYLDANATTAVLPAAAREAAHAMSASFGNPSSVHATGLRARQMVDHARTTAARVLGTGAGTLLFTSGATEAIQTAVLSALCALQARRRAGQVTGRWLLYGASEHKAVPESLRHWNTVLGLDLELRALPVDADGRHDLDSLRTLARDAAMVCTMAANNETGVVSDLAAIESILADAAPQALWLVDCVQALGKMPLALASTRIHYAAFSGHKLYAPKGIGMLYVREGAPFTPLMAGGGQEGGQRSGTENMAGVAALGAVLQALEDGETFRPHAELARFRDQLADALRRAFPGILFNAPLERSLPTTLNFSVPGFDGRTLLDCFDAAGIRVSAGSACSAARAAPSHVLEAMGLPHWRAAAAVRMSFGPATDAAFIARACERIATCGQALRPLATAAAVPAGAAPSADTAGRAALIEDSSRALCAASLRAFLATHPQAMLVDVREAYESRVDPLAARIGHPAIEVPLGRLLEDPATWTREPARPLVFVCRSGNRSARALAAVQEKGCGHAWHLAGGLALWPAAATAAPDVATAS